ncbi:hypothetical protein CPB84DRAFT_953420 [Gymnopilus junonius]|uniref:Zn(2)-C6 fungal-type domain-containing protein n=1 Tax=Gymnopilus junonius TaxID=109634 RepID=A0A9P5TMN6_GYMJU|nr:hypothetical protein CPB84DRAFT_953420 [Gymnopilus junonius]
MSKSRSTSLEIVPPSNSRERGLAEVMDSAFKDNQKQDEDDSRDYDDADAEAEVDEIEDQAAPIPHVVAASSNGPNAPTPCERCVRTGKQCKGVAGSRCDYCKRLKQKCSNSSGPARAVKKAAESGPPKVRPGAPSQASNHLKRKPPTKGSTPQNGDIDGHSIDGEGSVVDEDSHEPTSRPNKKRRISKNNAGPSRAQLLKAASDMEASIKRIRASIAKEFEKMNSVVNSIYSSVKEMDDE